MSKIRRTGSPANSVTVFFQGGLGNQLFQLAAGLDMAEGDQSRLVLDFTLLNLSGTVRSPEILELLNQNEFRAIYLQRRLYIFPLRILRSLLLRIKSLRSFVGQFGIITDENESDSSLIDRARTRAASVILLGYFQTLNSAEKLRKKITEVLRLEMLTESGNCNIDYLFIHMRRGDYLKFKTTYGVISENDLIKIGNKAVQELSVVRAYLASEDREAAIRVQGSLVVENGFTELISSQAKGVELLQMMVNAKGLVLANSSLSWWGAFLNQKNPVVYYPNPWFKSLKRPNFILESWVPFQTHWE